MIAAWKEKNDSRPSESTIAPDVLTDLNITDNEGNGVYRVVAMRQFSDDVVKAFRRNGVVAKPFDYDYQKWQDERNELQILREKFDNKVRQLNQISTDSFQEVFQALMHLKVIRAYIDGVLRFGIEPKKFTIAAVLPRKNTEKTILLQMTEVLAE